MADNWYYVQKGNRHGPVAIEVIVEMVSNQELNSDDFVWKKGFENWKKVKEVQELEPKKNISKADDSLPLPPKVDVGPSLSLKDLNEVERGIYVRIGSDRGGATNDYGPFSLKQLKQLFKENRINAKTYVFIMGSKEWKILADFPEYQTLFEELPPVIQEADRRQNIRKPLIARLFIQNNKNFYEGICRDVSIGGMQILVDDFKGNAGDRISINVHPENTDYHFAASGVVVRIRERNAGFSFRFQGLSDEAKRSIEKYVQEN
jgi:dihydrofolate reductase